MVSIKLMMSQYIYSGPIPFMPCIIQDTALASAPPASPIISPLKCVFLTHEHTNFIRVKIILKKGFKNYQK